MNPAEGLAARADQRRRDLRGRFALVLLPVMSVAGYVAMIYVGQAFLMR